jgi:2-polyprenyl-3-methyl-5-hydroxy-6-metoxy-1,4-benzoquinol methylase
MLDKLLESSGFAWWDSFFADRTKPCPFFVDWPDETLVSDLQRRAIPPGRVLELGCGNGSNAVYMASQGCSVDAVDFSEAAITWAKDRAKVAGQQVN